MTEPLTPAGCDLQDFPFMPLDVARLRDSELTTSETPEACWAALLLWCASWHQVPAGSLPNDERWIADKAGYVARGKVDKAWKDVKAGAMRGWVLCSDSRYYHPVVCEKARDAWQAKLEQRWRTECGRIKKHNDRHPGADVPRPTFEQWVSSGCPQGHPLPVPGDNAGHDGDVSRETTSKGEREGQGQGQGQGDSIAAPAGAGAAGAPPPAKPPKAAQPVTVAVPQLMADGLTEQTAVEWLAHRKRKAAPLTARAWQAIRNEADKAGWSIEDAVIKALARGWTGIEAGWLRRDQPGTAGPGAPPPNRQEAREQRNRTVAERWAAEGAES